MFCIRSYHKTTYNYLATQLYVHNDTQELVHIMEHTCSYSWQLCIQQSDDKLVHQNYAKKHSNQCFARERVDEQCASLAVDAYIATYSKAGDRVISISSGIPSAGLS